MNHTNTTFQPPACFELYYICIRIHQLMKDPYVFDERPVCFFTPLIHQDHE